MTYEALTKDLVKKCKKPCANVVNLANTISQEFPMIVVANLSKNTYTIIRDEGFLCNEITPTGCYGDLIDDNMDEIHPNYQQLFYECFSREHLIRSFQRGMLEVYAEIYQKNKQGQYHWVSVHVIRAESESGDIMHICLNRVLDGFNEKHYEQK